MKHCSVHFWMLPVLAASSLTYSQAAVAPISPLSLHFESAPEYFLQWISQNPEYRGIEAMTDPSRGIYRLGLFSADMRHTTYYTNRQDIADKLTANREEVYVTDIDMLAPPPEGAARVYEFRFHERKGRPVDWRISIDLGALDFLPRLPMVRIGRGMRVIDCAHNAIAGAQSVVVIADRAYPIDPWAEKSAEPYFTAYQGAYCVESHIIDFGLGEFAWKLETGPSTVREGVSWVLRDDLGRPRTLAVTQASARSMIVEQSGTDPSEQATLIFDCVGTHYSLREVVSQRDSHTLSVEFSPPATQSEFKMTIDGQREILHAVIVTIHDLAQTAWIFYLDNGEPADHRTLRSLVKQSSEGYTTEIAAVP